MRGWRRFSRQFILLDFTGEALATLAGLILLAVVAIRGGEPTAEALVEVAGSIGLGVVIVWAIRDARRRGRARRSGSSGGGASTR